jgi:hypothetical protein
MDFGLSDDHRLLDAGRIALPADSLGACQSMIERAGGWTDEQDLHFWYERVGAGRHLPRGAEFRRDRAAALQDLAAAS